MPQILTKGATNRDHTDNDNKAAVGLLDLEGERDEEDGNRVEGLEHLDEGHRQCKVGVVGEDERTREESTNGKNGTEPAVASHLNVLGTVNERGGALENTGGNGLEGQLSATERVHTEKARCQVVRKMGKGKSRLEKTYSGGLVVKSARQNLVVLGTSICRQLIL
jgi:hypothetical protein